MQTFHNKSSNQQPDHDEQFAYVAWGSTAGVSLGLVIGLSIGHWLAWTIMIGTLGMVVGGLIERSRR